MMHTVDFDYVEELKRLFPSVDGDTIEHVYQRMDHPSPENVAAFLETAAQSDVLEDRDYSQMLTERIERSPIDRDGKPVETPEFDPLEEPPDADPHSERNVSRGREARAWARENKIDKRAEVVAANGSVEEMIELLDAVDRWANQALLHPDLSGLSDTRFNRAMNTLESGIRGVFDALAARGAVGELEAAKDTVRGLRNRELEEGLLREIDGYIQLATASGTQFEAAKAYALDEGLVPWEVLKRVDDARYKFDITYEQQEQIEELATEWIEEYEQLQDEVGAA